MNELERQIRDLSLRQPGDSMDQRILSLLQSSGDSTPHTHRQGDQVTSSLMAAGAVKSTLANETTQSRRGILSATFAGLTTALLIGIVVGNAMPPLWSNSRSLISDNMPANADNAIVPENQSEAEFPSRHPMMPDVPAHVRDALKNRSTIGSQFVESSYQGGITGAVLWERQNGEIFNVATHVSDRRFDMCRDCHRVGG